MTGVTIYHNPRCNTSRNTLALIRPAGIEPTIVEYLKTPFERTRLESLIGALRIPARAVLRRKEPAFAELGLADPTLTEAALIDAMLAHPILIERPIVETPRGTRLCRPAETVLDILPA